MICCTMSRKKPYPKKKEAVSNDFFLLLSSSVYKNRLCALYFYDKTDIIIIKQSLCCACKYERSNIDAENVHTLF